MSGSSHEPELVDLRQFPSLNEALEKIEPGNRYRREQREDRIYAAYALARQPQCD